MRIIPKKIKVKNTVWKCYSMPDIIAALVDFAVIFLGVTTGAYALAVIMGLLSIVLFMPTQDGIFYTVILENVKFIFSKKKYTLNSKEPKENVDTLFSLMEIRSNGLLIAMGIMIIIAQRNEEKQKAKRMLVNYIIGLVAIAVIVVACPYLVRGIAILVT